MKLYEKFNEVSFLSDSIDDILVELGDIGIEWVVCFHNPGSDIAKHKINVIGVEIYKEPTDVEDEEGNYNPDGIYNYELGIEATNLFNFEDIYEPVMTLLSFMRDKYPNMTIDTLITVNNNPETDDWFEEFIKENDLESTTIEDIREFTNISSFDIEFTLYNDTEV